MEGGKDEKEDDVREKNASRSGAFALAGASG
jgi:hypothetical protein